MGHQARECSKKTAYFRRKDKNNIHQAEEGDQERHGQLEEETDMGTLSVCALEDVGESKNDASKSTVTKITTVPASGLTSAIMMTQCEEITANLKESDKQRNEAHEQSASSSSGQSDGCSQTSATFLTSPRESGGSEQRHSCVETTATSETG